MAEPRPHITFVARLGGVRPGDTWTSVQLPDSAQVFGTRGLVKVAGTMDGQPFTGAYGAGLRDPQAAPGRADPARDWQDRW